MDNVINMGEFIGAATGDRQHMLGKFLYFSLSNLLVEKEELSALCESMGIAYAGWQPTLGVGCVSVRHRRHSGTCSGHHGRRDKYLPRLLS